MNSVRSTGRELRKNGAAAPPPQRMILEETVALCTQVYKSRLRAVVLTGSLARDEGTFVTTADGVTLLGDAEFLVVFHDTSVLPAAADLHVIEGKLHERLRRRGVTADVSLSGVQGRFFRGVRPSIFGFELRTCGVVAWGDRSILELIPPFEPADIPLEDGWRLLANRLVEQLKGFDELSSDRSLVSAETHYRTVKLYLDMATSLLVFAGKYAPTYAQRADALASLAAGADSGGIPLDSFVQDVLAATRWKLRSKAPNAACSREFWQRAMEYAERLWSWELAQLTRRSAEHQASDLLETWVRRQPLKARLRGWAHVARREGMRGSIARWPRWLRSALRGSPRYLVYSVAVPMAFALRQGGGNARHRGVGSEAPAWQGRLPVASPRRGGGRFDTRDVVDLVLKNYQNFLVGTRA
jgi:hypothetical protein